LRVCADPTIEDSYRKQQVVDDKVVVLSVLDTAGAEEFSSIRDLNLRQADGCLLVFSVTDQKSFDELEMTRRSVLRAHDTDDFPTVLVGTKCDLTSDRVISADKAKALASSWCCQYIETSAKQNHNVEEAFFESVRAIRRARNSGDDEHGDGRRRKCTIL
jgi:GTPase KRas